MKVKVSRVMAKTLNKKCQNMTVGYEEMSERLYEFYVDTDACDHEEDYKWDIERYKVLRVDYPYEYCAMPQYITTKDLRRICQENDCKTIDELAQAIRERYEI